MSSEYGLPFWITWSSCLKGLIQSKRGDYEAGLARMQQICDRLSRDRRA